MKNNKFKDKRMTIPSLATLTELEKYSAIWTKDFGEIYNKMKNEVETFVLKNMDQTKAWNNKVKDYGDNFKSLRKLQISKLAQLKAKNKSVNALFYIHIYLYRILNIIYIIHL